MFALDICFKDKTVKPNFVSGRLRKYESFSFAYNASSQVLKNPKNDNIDSLYIWDCETKYYLAIVNRPTKNSKDSHANKFPLLKLENEKFIREEFKLKPISESDKKKVPITNIIKKVVKEKKDQDDQNKAKEKRVELLKEINEQRKLNKKEKEPVVRRESINNLSASHLKEKINEVNFEDTSFLGTLYAYTLRNAIAHRDARLFFNTEMALSKRNLSWYLNDKEEIEVDDTNKVLDLLNNR